MQLAALTIHTELHDLQSISSKQCWTKPRKIVKDLTHLNNGIFSCFCFLKANIDRMRKNFPWAVGAFNQDNTELGLVCKTPTPPMFLLIYLYYPYLLIYIIQCMLAISLQLLQSNITQYYIAQETVEG